MTARPSESASPRERLLAAASELFYAEGIASVGIDRVIAKAGVAKATLYNHFRTKDDVTAALLAAEVARLTALAAALPLEQALAALSDELGGHPVLRRLAETEPETLATLLIAPAERWAALVQRLATALALEDDSAELAARWLLGVVLQPGRSTLRRRHAAHLAGTLRSC